MDMEIYKDNLRNDERLNDEIIQQFIKLRKECEEFNKEYAELQKEHEALSEKNLRSTERLRQLMDELEFLSRVKGDNPQNPKSCFWPFCILFVLTIIYFCLLFTFFSFILNLKHRKSEHPRDNLEFIY